MTTQKSTSGGPIVHSGDAAFNAFSRLQERIREQAYRLFEGRGRALGDPMSDWLEAERQLLADVDLRMSDDEEAVAIEGEVKGFKPEEIEVQAKDGVLKVCGMHSEKSSSKEGDTESSSSKSMNFYHSFTLPDSVDTDKLEVSIKKGKLKAVIPKAAPG